MRHTSRLDSSTGSKTRTDPKRNSLHTKGFYHAYHGTYIDSVLREIYDAYKAARSTPSNCDGGHADHVPKRQFDLATRMMLEQASLSSNGDYEQSTILQLSLDCIDRAVEPITEIVSVRERSMHPEDNQTLSLRDVDPTAYDGVWAIIDDGCNSCSRSKAWRQNAEAKMKVLGLHPISLHKKATTFNDVGTSTTNGKPKNPTGVALCAVSLSWSRVPLSDDLLSLVQSMRAPSFLISLFSVESIGKQWMSRTPRPRSPLRTPMNMTGTTLGIPCHAHIGVFFEAVLDEEDTGRIVLSYHLALDILCDKDEVHRLEDHPNRHHSRYSDPFV